MASEENVYQRINAVQNRVETARKDRVNTHHRYQYVGHDDVTIALRRAMVECGLVQQVSVTGVERDGGRLGVRLDVAVVNIDKPDDRVVLGAYGEAWGDKSGEKGSPQQVGIAVSYAVKLTMLKLFMLIGDDSPDAEQQHGAATPATNGKPAVGPEIKRVLDAYRAIESLGGDDLRTELQKLADAAREVYGAASAYEQGLIKQAHAEAVGRI